MWKATPSWLNDIAMDAAFFDVPLCLAGTPLFSGLSINKLMRIAASCQLCHYALESYIFEVGDPCDSLYIVVSGQVKLFLVSSTGHEKVIEIISAGQSFAEALVFLDKPCILNAQTLCETVLVRVSKKGVFEEIDRDSHFAKHMLAGVSRHLHGLIQDVEGYTLRNGMQRLIGYLLRELDPNSREEQNTITLTLPASKATVASRLSLTPEYFSRILHELVQHKLIKINRREISILSVGRLIKYGSP